MFGNSTVEGTVIDNITYITTDKNLILANGASSSEASGSGIIVGNYDTNQYANILFNSSLNSWVAQPNFSIVGDLSVGGTWAINGPVNLSSSLSVAGSTTLSLLATALDSNEKVINISYWA